MSDNKQLQVKIEVAKRLVEAAENELEALMRELPLAEPRANKTAVSDVMQSAFEKLRAAKTAVSQLEELVSIDGG